MIAKLTHAILKITLVLLPFGAFSNHANGQEKYRYVLEEGKDKDLCEHMTQVFNHGFQTPWDTGPYVLDDVIPKHFGTPYDQIFERLPGVNFDRDFTFSMLLSKYPSSPEFDAIHWREGRVDNQGGSSTAHQLIPILITDLDLYNDGKKEWLVKFIFMGKMRTYEGMYPANLSDEDALSIFSSGGFDPNIPLTFNQLFHGQISNEQPTKLDSKVALQIRPLIYKDKTYLSAYTQSWPDRESVENPPGKPYQIYPNREYMNILRLLPGGELIDREVIETANTETVCHIRMHMLHAKPVRKKSPAPS